MSSYDYDLFVIGGGSGGVRAGRIAAGLGARVGMAEERYMGGTCVNVGCIPKKLFSYAAHYAKDFADARGYGWQFPGDAQMDWPRLIAGKDAEISRLNSIYQSLMHKAGVELFHERACLLDAHTISLQSRTVTAREILVATGGWPFVPTFPGSHHAITSNEAFELESLPESILIVGGGYIAVEFAGIFSALGAKTCLSYRGAKLLRGFDSEIAESFTEELCKYSGLHLESNVIAIHEEGTQLRACFDRGDDIVVDKVLFATGRHPNTANLGLDKAGVALADNGAIVVDEQFSTNVPNIHAVGDVIDRVALTPVALAEGQILAQRLFGQGNRHMDYDNIPTAVFCQPEIACVGLDEETARQRHGEILVFRSRFTPLRHTVSKRDEKTFMKLIVDKSTDKVLGAHMMGEYAAEIIQGVAIAIKAGASKADFDATLGIHPSAAEEFVTMRTPS
ncbi:MAG: glutathione-disulfide reductase [Pseudomonadales bacterium]|nr:glutathione-disulfide reductase [Pseudomonadales bacterium]MCP5331513.1 glutathione-disulfide reductase [Pseudomonadales bacterium]MCP5343396.1 glutathione-disulfide reductase [Pseudomonadales bacterium]